MREHFDEGARSFTVERVLVGEGELEGGVLHGIDHDEESGRFVASFCTATTPTQLHLLPADDSAPRPLTRERALGLAPALLSVGEDASFESHDGLRVSARLYLPSPELGFDGPRPLVYYVHGGPQSQERPNFAWFSMPLIQILTLEGFAVFVPNVRGSTGYGLDYSKHVDRDWGGLDRLDHVHAMTEVLPRDERVDTCTRGRCRAIVRRLHDTDARRAPPRALARRGRHVRTVRPVHVHGSDSGDLEAVLRARRRRSGDAIATSSIERSPKTYIDDISCPLLVIQGQNDPRVVERESRDVVEQLRGLGTRRRLPRLRGRGARRAEAPEPRSLLRRDRRLLRAASVLNRC